MSSQADLAVVHVKPTAKDIFFYKMYHSFGTFTGILRILVSTVFIVTAILTFRRVETLLTVLLFFFGLLNPVITPLWFLIQSSSAAATCIRTKYTFSPAKIEISDGKKRVSIHWEELSLVVLLKHELLLYTTPTQALVLPNEQMGTERDKVFEIIQANQNPKRLVSKKWL